MDKVLSSLRVTDEVTCKMQNKCNIMQNVTEVCNSDDDNGGGGDRVSDLAPSDKRAKRRKICGGGGGGAVRNSFADRLREAMERGNTPGESIGELLLQGWAKKLSPRLRELAFQRV